MNKINIVKSKVEPDKDSIWFYNGDLKWYSPNGWQSLIDNSTDTDNIEEGNLSEEDKEISTSLIFSEEDVNKEITDPSLLENIKVCAEIIFIKDSVSYTYFRVIDDDQGENKIHCFKAIKKDNTFDTIFFKEEDNQFTKVADD
jgi:hypothetical protein